MPSERKHSHGVHSLNNGLWLGSTHVRAAAATATAPTATAWLRDTRAGRRRHFGVQRGRLASTLLARRDVAQRVHEVVLHGRPRLALLHRRDVLVDERDERVEERWHNRRDPPLEEEDVVVQDVDEQLARHRHAHVRDLQRALQALQQLLRLLVPGAAALALWRAPEQVRTQAHHAALVGLLQQLARVLRRARHQVLVVRRVREARAAAQRRHDQLDHERLLAVHEVLVQDVHLCKELICNRVVVARVRALRALQEQPQRQLRVRARQRRADLVHELEHLPRRQRRRLARELAGLDAPCQVERAEDERRQRVRDAARAAVPEELASRSVDAEQHVGVVVLHEVHEARHELLLRLERVVALRLGRRVVLVLHQRAQERQQPRDDVHRVQHRLRREHRPQELDGDVLPVREGEEAHELRVVVELQHRERELVLRQRQQLHHELHVCLVHAVLRRRLHQRRAHAQHVVHVVQARRVRLDAEVEQRDLQLQRVAEGHRLRPRLHHARDVRVEELEGVDVRGHGVVARGRLVGEVGGDALHERDDDALDVDLGERLGDAVEERLERAQLAQQRRAHAVDGDGLEAAVEVRVARHRVQLLHEALAARRAPHVGFRRAIALAHEHDGALEAVVAGALGAARPQHERRRRRHLLEAVTRPVRVHRRAVAVAARAQVKVVARRALVPRATERTLVATVTLHAKVDLA
mmetsp:Transcript_25412/g.88678  ORF Transcript_25412/g.88678 Transcript_25412/m.88678 type:complete len:698 (+) Transcript_25412:734-2827(+)